jgi:hypothetical protein
MDANGNYPPQFPEAIKNNETYRPATDIVDNAMMKPTITPHHQLAIWKNRSPVRSEDRIIEVSFEDL